MPQLFHHMPQVQKARGKRSGQDPIAFSDHFARRAAQRNLSPSNVQFVIRHGRAIHRTGIVFYFLGKRDIPPAVRLDSSVTRLIGTTVLLARDGTVITAYKDSKALRRIKRKPKRRLRPA